MEILYYETIDSTQLFLIREIESGNLNAPIAVLADEQSSGIGSLDNKWTSQKGNFFASFALPLDVLPSDLPLASSSIYFGAIMCEILKNINEDIWLKWPNDIYVKEKKIAGIITKKLSNTLVCGIGINILSTAQEYGSLATKIEAKKILELYLEKVEKFPKWKQVFSNVQLEFHKSKSFYLDIEKYQDVIQDAVLLNDGSILINGKKVYSLR